VPTLVPPEHRKKGSQKAQTLGRSRGGFSTKIHISVDALGNPLRFRLTGGQCHDITQGEELIAGYSYNQVIADRSFDADSFLQAILKTGAVAVIPPGRHPKERREYDVHLYRERQLTECFINKIKHYRHIFSRFDKLASRYLGFLSFVGALIWLR
jgi:transposase